MPWVRLWLLGPEVGRKRGWARVPEGVLVICYEQKAPKTMLEGSEMDREGLEYRRRGPALWCSAVLTATRTSLEQLHCGARRRIGQCNGDRGAVAAGDLTAAVAVEGEEEVVVM